VLQLKDGIWNVMLLPKLGLHRFLWMDIPQHKFVPFQLLLMGIAVLTGVLIKTMSATKLKITVEVYLLANLQIISTNKT